MPRTIELMTVGYEGLTLKEFLALLARCRVTKILDIRELPISRKPGFAKNALAAALTKHGIQYEHMVDLGCPREVRHAYREDSDWGRYTKRYKAYLETQLATLEQLAALMREERCCLLCYEEDYNFCHRSFVAERMFDVCNSPMRVSHLTGPMAGRVVRRDLVSA